MCRFISQYIIDQDLKKLEVTYSVDSHFLPFKNYKSLYQNNKKYTIQYLTFLILY